MDIILKFAGRTFRVRQDRYHALSIPLDFSASSQPNHFGAPHARSRSIRVGDFIGDTRAGGSCNVQEISFVPHCNGTHTESVGHLTDDIVPVGLGCFDLLLPTLVLSIPTRQASAVSETYYGLKLESGDELLCAADLQEAVVRRSSFAGLRMTEDSSPSDSGPRHPEPSEGAQTIKALVVRTLPNSADKWVRVYGDRGFPAFFSTEAMEWINKLGVDHLLVDVPSLDKMYDAGELRNHRMFWNLNPGQNHTDSRTLRDRTVSEMIFVPDSVSDGLHVVNIQIPAFLSDAAPSRPILYEVEEQ